MHKITTFQFIIHLIKNLNQSIIMKLTMVYKNLQPISCWEEIDFTITSKDP